MGSVYAVTLRDTLLHAIHLANHIILDFPLMHGRRVVGNGTGCKVGDQLLVIELVQRKAITGLAVVFKNPFDIGNYPRIHFQLDVPCRIRLTGVLVVLVLKI